MKRAALGLLVVIALGAPGQTLAKVPWHSVETVPAAPVAGERLTVVVRFWDNAVHARPSSWSPESRHGGVLAFVGADRRVPVSLTRTGDGTLEAELTLTAGTWRLVLDQPYLDASGPTEVELATVIVGPPSGLPGPIGAAVVGLALVSAGAIWHGRRSRLPISAD